MKKRASYCALLFALTLLGACENETTVKRRGARSAVVPDDGALPAPGTVGNTWDGLSDRVDSVWGF